MILRSAILIIIQFFLFACNKHYYKQEEKFEHFSLKESQGKVVVNDSILRYKTKVDAETNKVIAVSESELTKSGIESTLGNFVCDALNYQAKISFKNDADIVIVNRGGLRINLPKGDIRVSTVFELMPFENEMVMVNITGEKLKQIMPFLTHPFLGPKAKMENNKTTITSVLFNGEPINDKKNYNIVTSDYLANGGDNFIFLKDPNRTTVSNIKIRDAIINYCMYLTENKKTIIPYLDGRVEISK